MAPFLGVSSTAELSDNDETTVNPEALPLVDTNDDLGRFGEDGVASLFWPLGLSALVREPVADVEARFQPLDDPSFLFSCVLVACHGWLPMLLLLLHALDDMLMLFLVLYE